MSCQFYLHSLWYKNNILLHDNDYIINSFIFGIDLEMFVLAVETLQVDAGRA